MIKLADNIESKRFNRYHENRVSDIRGKGGKIILGNLEKAKFLIIVDCSSW